MFRRVSCCTSLRACVRKVSYVGRILPAHVIQVCASWRFDHSGWFVCAVRISLRRMPCSHCYVAAFVWCPFLVGRMPVRKFVAPIRAHFWVHLLVPIRGRNRKAFTVIPRRLRGNGSAPTHACAVARSHASAHARACVFGKGGPGVGSFTNLRGRGVGGGEAGRGRGGGR